MRLAHMTDYAVRLLIYLAQHPQRLCTIGEVASAYAISETHLMKITHHLALEGWLETTRGKGGGIRLAKPAAQIGLGAVVRTMEPDFFLVECFSSGNNCSLTGSCELTGVMDGALRSFMDYLDQRSLADVLPPPAGAVRAHPIHVVRGPKGRRL